jgi:hypothetical protein
VVVLEIIAEEDIVSVLEKKEIFKLCGNKSVNVRDSSIRRCILVIQFFQSLRKLDLFHFY